MKTQPMHKCIILVLVFLSISGTLQTVGAQVSSDEKSAPGAMLRSLILPGWGHYYIDNNNWSRGRVHLIADVALLSSYLGIELNTGKLEQNRVAFAKQHAGIDLNQHGRNIRLNIADFNSVHEFNDFQERTRNWNLIIYDTEATYWKWDAESRRREFMSLNNRIDQQRQQLPAILSLMLVNRVIAGIHAYSTATTLNDQNVSISILPVNNQGVSGYTANLRIAF